MNTSEAILAAADARKDGLCGKYPLASQVLAEEVFVLRQNSMAVELLRDLATALDGAFISSWQTTAAWQKELDSALEFIRRGPNVKLRGRPLLACPSRMQGWTPTLRSKQLENTAC